MKDLLLRTAGAVGLLFVFALSYAQTRRPEFHFGQPATEDFSLNSVPFDSGASAIVIADFGRSEYKNISHDNLVLLFTRTMRVKIVSAEGIQAGTYSLWLHRQKKSLLYEEVKEKLENINGIVFNREDGQTVSTNLDKSQVFTEAREYGEVKKFTMPALKAGSVFDLTYSISSDWNEVIRSWQFQGTYPCLWSEYNITVPPGFNFVMQRVGDDKYAYSHKEDIFQQFYINKEHGTNQSAAVLLEGNSIRQVWAKKDLPGVVREDFSSSPDNFVPALFFQLNFFKWYESTGKYDEKGSWTTVIRDLMNEGYFGQILNQNYNWDAEMKLIQPGTGSAASKARQVYSWVRDNFHCRSSRGIYTSHTLKETVKSREGSVVDINLLLTALLRQVGVPADPVFISTRENGIADQSYPQLSQFNYILCGATLNNRRILLDATQHELGFGNLGPECYNGLGRVVSPTDSGTVRLYVDSLREKSSSTVFISNDGKDFLVGSFEERLGEMAALDARQKKSGLRVEDRIAKISADFSGPVHVENASADSLDQPGAPLTLRFDFDLKDQAKAEMLYFNPVLQRHISNPFPPARRHFPVELPNCPDENYTLSMEVPAGYVVEEIPKSARVNLNEDDAFFEYAIQSSPTRIQLRVHLKFSKTIFSVADYQTLRDFYSFIVKKEAEQIVFKKNSTASVSPAGR